MRKIIRKQNGEARLIVIMAVIAVVLAIIVIVPKVKSFSEERVRQQADVKYEDAAKRLAQLEITPQSGGSSYAYDGLLKQFVEPRDALSLTPYGNSEEHTGKIILVTVSENRQVTTEWYTPQRIAGGNYGEETNR